MVNDIKFIRKGKMRKVPKKKEGVTIAQSYNTTPNTAYIPNYKKTMIVKPRHMAKVLSHESVHGVLQKRISERANLSFDNIFKRYKEPRF